MYKIFYILYLYIIEKLSFLELCTKVHPELMEKASPFWLDEALIYNCINDCFARRNLAKVGISS